MNPALKGLDPFIVNEAKFLILGSFPSVKSLEFGFYYMHPANKFYPIIAKIFQEETPKTIAERKEFLIRHEISLFDMIASCHRLGSLDSNIKDAVLNDLTGFFSRNIRIGCTGKTSYKLFQKLYPDHQAFYLSSPSPANQKHFNIEDYRSFFLKPKI